MKNKIVILLLAVLLGGIFVKSSGIKPPILPTKTLSTLSDDELKRLFEEANQIYKMEELRQLAAKMGEDLNGTLLIAQDNHIHTQRAYGYLQLYRSSKGYGKLSYNQLTALRKQSSNKITDTTLFDLASASKQFTAAAILKLCEQGKLQLSDSLGKFFPKLPYRTVTLHQMLTHTSGIPEYFTFPYTIYDTAYYVDNLQLIRILSRKKLPRKFPAGTRFSYCNTNYALLAAIVSKVAGMRFEEYVHRYLWEPAGMRHTCFFTELDSLRKQNGITDIARGHWKSGNLADHDRLNGILGDKGVYSNAEDLLKWTNAFFIQHKILSESSVAKATKQENILSGDRVPEDRYGYGFRIEENPHFGTLIYHGGLWNGFLNLYLYRPEDRLLIIFLSNYYNSAHKGKSDEVLHILDGA